MFIADAHCDTLYAIALEGAQPEDCSVTPQRLRDGNVSIQTFALFAGSKGPQGTPYRDGAAMLEAARTLPIPFLRGALPDEMPEEPTGVFSCEGGEMLEGSLARLAEFDDAVRLRMIALTWNHENEIGYPAKGGSALGLKPFGFELIREMDRRGILCDVSHLNDAGFWDVIETAALPPIASHSDCRWLCDVPRNLNREMAQALIRRKGFIGVNFYTSFLTKSASSALDDVRRHIDALYELGGEDVVGFGSDFDGIDSAPKGLENPSHFPRLLDFLARSGYTDGQLEKLAGRNLWRVLKQADEARRV